MYTHRPFYKCIRQVSRLNSRSWFSSVSPGGCRNSIFRCAKSPIYKLLLAIHGHISYCWTLHKNPALKTASLHTSNLILTRWWEHIRFPYQFVAGCVNFMGNVFSVTFYPSLSYYMKPSEYTGWKQRENSAHLTVRARHCTPVRTAFMNMKRPPHQFFCSDGL